MKRSKNRSKTKSKSKSRSGNRKIKKEQHSLPMCKPKLYCGGKPKAPSLEGYDKLGSKDECFRKGMGVGMMIELQKIKTKLASKGIILVTKQRQKTKCIDKNGNIKLQ